MDPLSFPLPGFHSHGRLLEEEQIRVPGAGGDVPDQHGAPRQQPGAPRPGAREHAQKLKVVQCTTHWSLANIKQS